jgi:nicotinamide-nucleotide amidase
MNQHEALVRAATALGQRVARDGGQLACAESCTGGLISMALTETAGSSAWFDRGFVTYSNAAKTALLGVDANLIEQHGAVSEAVALAMAQGALARSLAAQGGLAMAVTGIAGPSGAVPGKAVGTVCFAFAWPSGSAVVTRIWRGDRANIRHQSAVFSLQEAQRLWLKNHFIEPDSGRIG